MTNTRYTVRRGQTVELGVKVGDEPVSRRGVGGSTGSGGYVGAEEAEEELYVFQKKGVQFYDIGMALKPDDTYEEVGDSLLEEVIPSPIFPPTSESGEMTLAQAETFNDLLVGKYLAGLFDKIPGTTRPNRKVVKFDAEDYFIDVWQRTGESETEPEVSVIGRDEVRPKLGDPTGPNWQNKGWKDLGTDKGGVLKLIPNIKSLEVKAHAYFFDFKTDNLSRFRITEEPDPAAHEVELVGLPSLRAVYLVPQILRARMSYIASGTFIGVGAFGSVRVSNAKYQRISPYASHEIPLVDYAAVFPTITDPGTIEALAQGIVDAGVYEYAIGLEPERFPPPREVLFRTSGVFDYRREFMIVTLPDDEGFEFYYFTTLRAVLKTKSKTYYVWLRDHGADGGSNFLNGVVANGPFAHELVTDAPL